MNKQARSYLEMQLEEPRLDSGRYRVAAQELSGEEQNPILASFKRAAYSLGLDLGEQAAAGQRFQIKETASGR